MFQVVKHFRTKPTPQNPSPEFYFGIVNTATKYEHTVADAKWVGDYLVINPGVKNGEKKIHFSQLEDQFDAFPHVKAGKTGGGK